MKTKAFIVKSSDLFNKPVGWIGASKGKLPGHKGDWSVSSIAENPKIKKHCPACGMLLIPATVYEHGEEDDALYCLNCN